MTIKCDGKTFKNSKAWLEYMDNKRAAKPFYFKLWYWHIKPYLDTFESWLRSRYFYYKNGFDYRDCWSLDKNISKYILPRLKHLKKIKHGYPGKLKSGKQWENILNKIILAFELLLNEESYWLDKNGNYCKRKMDKRNRLVKEGLQLFAEYFENLWD